MNKKRNKKLFYVVTGFTVVMLLMTCFVLLDKMDSDGIIPNKCLDRVVRSELGVGDRSLTIEDCQNVKVLNVGKCDTNTDLEGLEYFESLEILYANAGRINDISALSKLVNLVSLEMRINKISDLTPLANLDKLESIVLRDNNISDISPLFELPNLKVVDLTQNPIDAESMELLKKAYPYAEIRY